VVFFERSLNRTPLWLYRVAQQTRLIIISRDGRTSLSSFEVFLTRSTQYS